MCSDLLHSGMYQLNRNHRRLWMCCVCLCCCSTKKKEKGGFLFKIKGRVKQKIWRQREGNKQGEGWRVRTDKQAGRLGYRSEGVIRGWVGRWSDGKQPATSRQNQPRSQGWERAKPRSCSPAPGQSAPNSPTDLHPISIGFHLLPGVTHKHTRAHTDISTKTRILLLAQMRAHTHTRTLLPLPITIAQWQDKW